MKYALAFFSALLFGACSNDTSTQDETDTTKRTTVTLTHPSNGYVEQQTVMQATTAYLSKTTVASPIAAFVKQTSVGVGARVKAGQLLYRLESKEQHALGYGEPIEVRAPSSGIVIEALGQNGSYVSEGQMLCTIADATSLVFEISVPYEQHHLARSGAQCTVELADGKRYAATLQLPLASMLVESQSMLVVARARVPLLPEGMRAKAIFTYGGGKGKVLILPKQAVQSSEDLSEHWVMTMRADSTAAKVAVTTGNSDNDNVEILGGVLTTADRVILTGGYGLQQGDKVRVER